MDTVFVRDLSVKGRHGVHEHERQTEQEFLLDIEATFDARPAAASDALGDTVDYVNFVDVADRIVAGSSFFLIEKLAEMVAQEILKDERIYSVRVTVRKPSVLASGVPGITIERIRI